MAVCLVEDKPFLVVGPLFQQPQPGFAGFLGKRLWWRAPLHLFQEAKFEPAGPVCAEVCSIN
jgi:hypothetical protein